MILIDNISEDMNRVFICVLNAGDAITAPDIAEVTGMRPNTVRLYLRRLDERGLITRPYRGQYLVTDKSLYTRHFQGVSS